MIRVTARFFCMSNLSAWHNIYLSFAVSWPSPNHLLQASFQIIWCHCQVLQYVHVHYIIMIVLVAACFFCVGPSLSLSLHLHLCIHFACEWCHGISHFWCGCFWGPSTWCLCAPLWSLWLHLIHACGDLDGCYFTAVMWPWKCGCWHVHLPCCCMCTVALLAVNVVVFPSLLIA